MKRWIFMRNDDYVFAEEMQFVLCCGSDTNVFLLNICCRYNYYE